MTVEFKAPPFRADRAAHPITLDRPAGCRLIDIAGVHEADGHLSFVEAGRHVPFGIKRVFYIDNVPQRATRAQHALRRCEQLIIALNGGFEVNTDDGLSQQRWCLEGSSRGLYLPAMVWREVTRFSPGAVCLVLASETYREDDYIRSHDEFRRELARLP